MAADRGTAQPPPGDLSGRTFDLAGISAGTPWFRIARSTQSPVFFSQSDGWRFSAPAMPGTLYLADREETCFWEVFWDDLVSRPPGEQRLDLARVAERSLWKLSLPRLCHVVDATDPVTLRRLGAHGGTFLGPYAVCQQWAAALRSHPLNPDGILYESARDKGRRCLALFAERIGAENWPPPGAGHSLVGASSLAALILELELPALDTDPAALTGGGVSGA